MAILYTKKELPPLSPGKTISRMNHKGFPLTCLSRFLMIIIVLYPTPEGATAHFMPSTYFQHGIINQIYSLELPLILFHPSICFHLRDSFKKNHQYHIIHIYLSQLWSVDLDILYSLSNCWGSFPLYVFH